MPTKKQTFSFERMRMFFFFSLIVLLSIAMLYLFAPFFYPIFWAAIIAVMFAPFHNWCVKTFKHPGTSAFLSLTTVLVVLIIPLSILATLIVSQSFDLYQSIAARDLSQDVTNITAWADSAGLAPYIAEAKTQAPQYITQIAEFSTNFVLKSASGITQNSLQFMFMFFLMLYTLYYFFKDGKRMLKRLMHLSPLGDKYEQKLFDRFNSVTRATMKSTFIIGGIQGFIAGLMFWLVGIEGALIWGVIMTILSIIPAIGSVIVWLPAGLIMLALGHVWQGVTILVVGTFVISALDNLLRPPLIGKDVEMHPLLVLVSTLGGLIIFGVSGFVIGPIIASLYLAIMNIYDHYYKHELSHN
jgi:predicted PurR-regulated permease PerM